MAEKRNEDNVPEQVSLSTPEASKSQTASESEEDDTENTNEQEADEAGHPRGVLLNIPIMSASVTREGLGAGRLAMGQRSSEFMNMELCHDSTTSLMNIIPTVSSNPGPSSVSVMCHPPSFEASLFCGGSRGGRRPGRGRSSPGVRPFPSYFENPAIPESVYRPYSEIDMRWRFSNPIYEKYKRMIFNPWKHIGGIRGLPGFLEDFQDNLMPRVEGFRPIRKRLFQTDRYRHPDIPYVFPPRVASSLPRSTFLRPGTSSRVSRTSTHIQPSTSRGAPTAAAGSSSRSRIPVGSAETGAGTGTGRTGGSADNDNDIIDSIMNPRNPQYADGPLLPDPTDSHEYKDIYE